MTPKSWLLLAITAISAACGLVIEIVAGRMIAPYLGMSLYTWTAIIAVVLAGFSIGHWIGGRIAEQSHARIQRGIAWSLLLAGISSAASLLLIRLVSGPIIGLGLAPVPTILLLTTILFFLPSLFVGVPSPALTKLAIEENKGPMGHVLGVFYAAGAAGSIFGTLAAGYIFISWLGTVGTVLTVAGTYVVMAGIMFWLSSRSGDARHLVAPLAALVVSGSVVLAGGNQLLAFRSNCDVESDYYCIRVIELTDQIGIPARSMVLNHLEHGVNVRDRPQDLLSPYVEAQYALARIHASRRSPMRIFLIGGGGYTLPRAWLDAGSDTVIHVAEIDPAVTKVAFDRMWLAKSDRLKIIHADARRALNEMENTTFDVIVGDAFQDISVPQHLVTSEFFSLVKERLNSDGIYLMNVVDHLERPRLALSILMSLKPSFPVVEMWRSNQSGTRATFVIAGLRKPTPNSRLVSRMSRGLEFQRVSGEQLKALVETYRPFRLTDDYAPVDRLIAVQ